MKHLDSRDNRDIIEKIRRRITLKVFLCAFLSLGMAAFFALYGFAYFENRMGLPSAVVTCICGIALPFFLLKLHKELFDRSFEGTVLELKTYLVRPVATRVIEEWRRMLVETSDGDLKTVKAHAEELARFRLGDRVRHIRGTRYLQGAREGRTSRDCVICGCLVREEGDSCPHCGYSLVKFEYYP